MIREITFRLRDGFYVGLGLAFVAGTFLIWLWQPDRQVSRHSEKLLRGVEARDWEGVAEMIADDYADQWGQGRMLVLARLRETFRYVSDAQISANEPIVTTANGNGTWRAKILIQGNRGEVIAIIKDRVNSLTTPFELKWRQSSGKPWDWKLVWVGNPELQLPAGFD